MYLTKEKRFKTAQKNGLSNDYLEFMSRADLEIPPHYVPHVIDEHLFNPIITAITKGEKGLSLESHEQESEFGHDLIAFKCRMNASDHIDESICFMLHHLHYYGSVISVVCMYPTKKELGEDTDNSDLQRFCSKLNRVDLLHRIHCTDFFLLVERQFSLCSGLCDIDSFINFLRELREYTCKISRLEQSLIDKMMWKQFLISPRKDVKTAEEILFPEDENNVLYDWATSGTALDDGTIEHNLYFMCDASSYEVYFGHWSLPHNHILNTNPKIITYPDAPYLVKICGKEKTQRGFFTSNDEADIQQFCDQWNSIQHFSSCKLHWNREADETYSFDIVITGLIAGTGNTMTLMGLIGLFEKTVCAIYDFHWRMETMGYLNQIRKKFESSEEPMVYVREVTTASSSIGVDVKRISFDEVLESYKTPCGGYDKDALFLDTSSGVVEKS